MIPAPFRVVLDACVLYPFTLRDVLLQAAADGFYQVYWTEDILDEALRNLVADGRVTLENSAKLGATMRRAFPEAQVSDYEALIAAMRNDEKDRHVVAAAVRVGAQVIVTSNQRDFYALPSGLEAQNPDEFLSTLFDRHPRRMMSVLHKLAGRYRSPPMEVQGILNALKLPEFEAMAMAALRKHRAQ